MPAEKFSFAVTGLLGLDPELKQDLLEMTNPQQRLGTVLELLNGIN
jgi:Lon protease-like protein